MREIKFRQYWQHQETGTISTSVWTLNQLKQGIGGVDRHALVAETQYTGVKDRNGKEIYEGDIVVRWTKPGNSNKFYRNTYHTKEVKWGTHLRRVGFNISDSVKVPCYEVIGNIYEPPKPSPQKEKE